MKLPCRLKQKEVRLALRIQRKGKNRTKMGGSGERFSHWPLPPYFGWVTCPRQGKDVSLVGQPTNTGATTPREEKHTDKTRQEDNTTRQQTTSQKESGYALEIILLKVSHWLLNNSFHQIILFTQVEKVNKMGSLFHSETITRTGKKRNEDTTKLSG